MLFGVPSVYSFDIVQLIKDGDGRFHKTYTRFRKHVKQALVSVSMTCSVMLESGEYIQRNALSILRS